MDNNKRTSFVFYKDWYNAIVRRSDNIRLEIYDAIMKKVFEDVDVNTSEIASVVLDFIMPQVERDVDKWLEIKEKRRIAGKKHKGNQYNKMEQILSNGTNVPSVPITEQMITNDNKMEQNGTNGSVSVNVNDNVNVNNNKEIEDKSSKKKNDDEFVERIYKMYPTRCPIRNLSLGKSYKDKERIKRLLKLYSKEDIEKMVRKEIDEKYGKTMMSNFSTFLNNFPDPSTLFEVEGFQDSEKQSHDNPYKDYNWQ